MPVFLPNCLLYAPLDMTGLPANDNVSATELLATMVEAKHMLEIDITELNKVKDNQCKAVASSHIGKPSLVLLTLYTKSEGCVGHTPHQLWKLHVIGPP